MEIETGKEYLEELLLWRAVGEEVAQDIGELQYAPAIDHL